MYEIGKTYNRARDIHGKYGGQRQGGISTPKGQPFVFLFAAPSGHQYGYQDGWDAEGVFLYTGEGQRGNMVFRGGNKAIRDHAAEGKDLLMFESLGKGRGYRYRGAFACASWEYRRAPDKSGRARNAIVFHLLKEDEPQIVLGTETKPASRPLEELRRGAYDAASPAAETAQNVAKRTYYERSEVIRRYVLARANGICEACRKRAPFNRPDGSPYLEPHHTRQVSDGGPDHPRWIGAVCPNCHREIHHGATGREKNRQLEVYLADVEDRSESSVGARGFEPSTT